MSELMRLDLYPRIDEVILSQVSRGKGTEEDPCRIVLQVHTLDGHWLAESDPVANGVFIRLGARPTGDPHE